MKVWTKMAGSSLDDYAYGVAVDTNSGAVYVAGLALGSFHGQTYQGQDDALLIKYDQDGTRLWTKIVGTTADDAFQGVTVDITTGDIYLTGYVSASLHGQTYNAGLDILIMKYASNGTRIWTKIVGTSSTDYGTGISLDSTAGSFYVTGSAGASLHGQTYSDYSDIFLMLYDCNGTRIWTRMVGTLGSDAGFAVAADGSTASVYVTGYVSAAFHGQSYSALQDIVLMKYSITGSRIWTRMLGTSSSDFSNAVAVDSSSGSIYITGYSSASLNGQTYVASTDVFMVKYGSDGTRLWTKMVGSSGGDAGYSVSVDAVTGDVYFAGQVSGNLHGQTFVAGADVLLMKYDGNGTRVWTRIIGTSGDDLARGLAMDFNTGMLYLAGYAGGSVDAQTYSAGKDVLSMGYLVRVPFPTSQPSGQPSRQPTSQPTRQPTGQPSSQPTCQPTGQPSSQPTCQPSYQPSEQPSSQPTSQPNMNPSSKPSRMPSCQPTSYPSRQPTAYPSAQPYSHPSRQPSSQPSCQPSGQPSRQPSRIPTSQPSSRPTVQPWSVPSVQPTRQPSRMPTCQPTTQPSRTPSRQPSSQPTRQPMSKPSQQPSGQPSCRPSAQPTCQPSTRAEGDTVCRRREWVDLRTGVRFHRHQCYKTMR